ncbi:MAG: hypothetical protein K0U74_12755 [Alphaproteobacteria bacterium]|nr:hypothetical protein [Alphaproteobacteria bacterium]
MRALGSGYLGQAGLACAIFAGVIAVSGLTANDVAAKRSVPDAVKVACSGDYKRFCKGYTIGTAKLNSCMRAKGKRLSRVCVRALVDHGMVPRHLLRKARRR